MAERSMEDAGVALVVSIAFFLIGLTAAFFLEFDIPIVSFNLFPAMDLLLLGLAVFVFAMLFFGKLTQLFFFLVGASQVLLLKTAPVLLFFNAIPLFLFGFTGTLFGMRLLDDLEGKDNLYDYKKELLMWFAISAIVAIVAGILQPQLMELNAMIFQAAV